MLKSIKILCFVGVVIIWHVGENLAEREEPSIVLTPGEVPYMVSVQQNNLGHQTTAVILDENHIMTSAKGLSNSAIYSYRIIAGQNNWAYDGHNTGQTRNLTKMWNNPDYCFVQGDMMGNNLKIMRVSEPFEFNEFVQPIALPQSDHPSPGENALASGWINLQGSILRKIAIPTLTSEQCFSFFGKYKYRTAHLCAAFLHPDETAFDANYGFDEGSPLVCRSAETDEDYLCGIFSYVNPAPACQSATDNWGFPMVFTQVSKYIDWIDRITNTP